MGGGPFLKCAEDSELRANVQSAVDGMAVSKPNGCTLAFNDSEIDSDNSHDYSAGWATRGLLDAHRAGILGARELNRAVVSLFHNHSRLAWFLPPNGGPEPYLPYPLGFDNVTDRGYGIGPGCIMYIRFQGVVIISNLMVDCLHVGHQLIRCFHQQCSNAPYCA